MLIPLPDDDAEDGRRRAEIGRRIADAYERQPQTAEELAGIDALTEAMILEETW